MMIYNSEPDRHDVYEVLKRNEIRYREDYGFNSDAKIILNGRVLLLKVNRWVTPGDHKFSSLDIMIMCNFRPKIRFSNLHDFEKGLLFLKYVGAKL